MAPMPSKANPLLSTKTWRRIRLRTTCHGRIANASSTTTGAKSEIPAAGRKILETHSDEFDFGSRKITLETGFCKWRRYLGYGRDRPQFPLIRVTGFPLSYFSFGNLSDLNLVYAYTRDKTLMIGAQACELSEKDLEAALRLAHPEVVKSLDPQIRLAAKAGEQKREYKLSLVSNKTYGKIRSLAEAPIEAVFKDPTYGKV